VRHGKPEHEQVLLWLWELVVDRSMLVLQPSQPALCKVLRLMWTQAQDQRVEPTKTPPRAKDSTLALFACWCRKSFGTANALRRVVHKIVRAEREAPPPGARLWDVTPYYTGLTECNETPCRSTYVTCIVTISLDQGADADETRLKRAMRMSRNICQVCCYDCWN